MTGSMLWFRWVSAALPLVLAATGASAQSVRTVVDDAARGVKISVSRTDDRTLFIFVMPKGSSAMANIDANADGVWGYGPYDASRETYPEVDRSISVLDNGSMCGVYIRAARADDPDALGLTSTCSSRLFDAYATRSAADAEGRVMTTYSVRSSDIFQGRANAHLAFSVWIGSSPFTYFSPRRPFILEP